MSDQESNVELQEEVSTEIASVDSVEDLEKLKTTEVDIKELVAVMLKLAENEENKAIKIVEEYASRNSASDFLDAFRDALVTQKQNNQTEKNK